MSQRETSKEYKTVHKKSGIEFINHIYNLYVSAEDQLYYAQETLKCKLIRQSMGDEMNVSALPEVRNYINTDRDTVVNAQTRFTKSNDFHGALGGSLQDYIDDHLNYYANLPARNMQTYESKSKKKKK